MLVSSHPRSRSRPYQHVESNSSACAHSGGTAGAGRGAISTVRRRRGRFISDPTFDADAASALRFCGRGGVGGRDGRDLQLVESAPSRGGDGGGGGDLCLRGAEGASLVCDSECVSAPSRGGDEVLVATVCPNAAGFLGVSGTYRLGSEFTSLKPSKYDVIDRKFSIAFARFNTTVSA